MPPPRLAEGAAVPRQRAGQGKEAGEGKERVVTRAGKEVKERVVSQAEMEVVESRQ